MAIILQEVQEWYRDLMDNKSDPRVNDFFLLSSPLPTLCMCIFYAYFSKSLGPRLMAKRKPMELRSVLVSYSCPLCPPLCLAHDPQSVLFASLQYLMSGWWGHYSFKCQPVDYSTSGLAMRMVNICWWYYISKFTEFFDTLFFILRKKNEHVSTLHVIHHGCMPFSVWMGLKFAPGGHSTFFALLNSFVHIVMYFYYMIAAMGPKYQKYIWWKKYLTTFQMLLFRDCDYPKGFMVWIGLHGVMFLFLFSDFYKAKYLNAARRRRQAVKAKANGHANGALSNGLSKHFGEGDALVTNGSNTGACMPVMEDEYVKSNGHANGAYKDGFLSNNDAIFNPDSSSSSLHQRKVK
ncbi:hypothetical protein M5D96_001182 [Drosophila gunungcola]|uniref:Elongation of very long chain fatty acids protein n=1 Tax=Drosophila gunungcola TaxID=103775 RepID=A0A9Q0BV36_9MUSC|nr:hypothetical protein M5D96_001182 [Drosophila gunungcola]